MDISKIKELYFNTSKHSNYQILPQRISNIIEIPNDRIISRFEKERLDFISKKVDFTGKKVLDIGGNTGYFSFESLDLGADSVTHIEGNAEHSDFVKNMARLTDSDIKTLNTYFDFNEILKDEYFDVVFNLNVIHHLGDDFGDNKISKEKALQTMSETFKYFEDRCGTMIFQMGFCWKGDRNELLFENGTKSEMIDFVKNSIGEKWKISTIGIAETTNNQTFYNELSSSNIERNDLLGEFRNRPIFIINKK